MKRFELPYDAWTAYDSAWLSTDEASDLLATLLAEQSWEHRPIVVFGREVPQPRLMTWAGEVPYRYSGQTLEPRPLDGVLGALTERVSRAVGVPFNHVVLNRYRDGRDNIGMHADDERELGRNPMIAALSLGVDRDFVLSPKDRRKKRLTRRFPLQHGSLLVMGGSIQHTWRHGVPRQPSVQGERVNLTFRWLKGPPGWREPGPPDVR